MAQCGVRAQNRRNEPTDARRVRQVLVCTRVGEPLSTRCRARRIEPTAAPRDGGGTCAIRRIAAMRARPRRVAMRNVRARWRERNFRPQGATAVLKSRTAEVRETDERVVGPTEFK